MTIPWKRASLVIVLVIIFFISVSLVPITNKTIFKGTTADNKFSYPLTVTVFELLIVCTFLFLFSIIKHFVWDSRLSAAAAAAAAAYDDDDSSKQSINEEKPLLSENSEGVSWILGPHLWAKFKVIWLVGMLFGMKLGLTNWGLQLLPTNTHLLLQSTSLVWVMLGSWTILGERPKSWFYMIGEILCCVLAMIGTVFISLKVHSSQSSSGGVTSVSALGLIVNLSSTIFEGLCITFLRKSAHIVFPVCGCAGPTGQGHGFSGKYAKFSGMTPFEFTLVKLIVSMITVLPFAILFEGFNILQKFDIVVWNAIAHMSMFTLGMLFIGGLVTVVFQTNITALSAAAGAVAVGIVGHIKVLPQVIFSMAILHTDFIEPSSDTSNVYHITGAVCIALSGICYSALKMYKLIQDKSTSSYAVIIADDIGDINSVYDHLAESMVV